MKKTFLILIILAALLTSCNLPTRPVSNPGIDQAQAGTIVAMTLSAVRTQTPSPSALVINSPVPSTTNSLPSPEVTATQTVTVTPTYAVPIFSFSENTNCREGPGTDYKVITLIRAGQQATGAGMQGSYWIVNNPNGSGTCWVPNELTSPSGSTWTLPTVAPPLAKTGEPIAAPTWANWEYFCGPTAENSLLTMTMTLKWTDRANNEIGYKVYRNGELIATLGPGTNSYTDIASLTSGKSLNYYIEVFTDTVHATSSTISSSCQ
jgi:hypothetical protein